jgi:hypothetical protein
MYARCTRKYIILGKRRQSRESNEDKKEIILFTTLIGTYTTGLIMGRKFSAPGSHGYLAP